MSYKVNGVDLELSMMSRDFHAEGVLWTVGYNGQGQLGDTTIVNKSSPIQTIARGTNWKSVAGSQYHTAAIKTDGTLWTWGNNPNGQLGDNTATSKSSPIQTIAGGTIWKAVSCGQNHTIAIKTDGTLWVWGSNASGQLGDGTITRRSSPIQTIAGGTIWKSAAGGFSHTAAVKTDGTLWMCGYNIYGQLGDGTVAHKSSPVQTVGVGSNWKSVSCGMYHTAAIKTDGTLWIWGYNASGQLADGSVTMKSSPIQTIAGGTNWKSVACGQNHTSAITTDGTLWMCGYNGQGQLGDGTIAHKSSPVQTVGGGTNWRSSAGGGHTAAIKTDGTLWVYGNNSSGQLGDNTITSKSSPVQTVIGGTNWRYVACSSATVMATTDTP